jgi:two-component system response regulator PilR (NtrC family)
MTLLHIFDNFLTFSFPFFRSMDTYVTNKTILLVDDDLDFCDLIAPILEKQGFKVITAYTLESAKVQLIAYSPSIILLDHIMPDGLGAEFLVSNKKQLENKNVIFITGDPSSDLMDKVKDLGVFDFLPKPFHPSVLNKIIYLAATFN